MAEYSKPTNGIISSNTQRPPATETVEGIAEIATQAETDAATDDTRFITPLKLGKGQPNGVPSLAGDGKIPSSQLPDGGSLIASTQWNKTLPSPVTLPNGSIANGFTFFDNVADKDAGGTTSYSELNIAYGITITLSGTGGTANINVDGVDYLATFDTDLFTTANNWVTANSSTLMALGIGAFALGSGADGRIRFGATADTILNAITITNVTPDLSGTIANEFTGSPTASNDHCLIPYVGEPYEGLRIHQTIRANFNIATGSVQYAELGLFRYADDTQIGSAIAIVRNPDITGNLVVIETYTAGASDPFVLGGFYIALNNQTGTSLDFIGASGILIQSTFQKPVNF